MNCRSAESLFSAFLEDELNQKERRSMETHLLSCRRCSIGVREVRAALQVLGNVPSTETSPHFEEDVLLRIRSGEAMRPSTVEWIRGLFAPVRLRPLFLAGAGACAVWIAVLVADPALLRRERPDRMAESSSGTNVGGRSAGQPAAPAQGPSMQGPSPDGAIDEGAAIAALPAGNRTPSAVPSRIRRVTETASAERELRAAPDGSQESILPNPGSRYVDEYITDQFYLERELNGVRNPTLTPVSDRASDDVYITF